MSYPQGYLHQVESFPKWDEPLPAWVVTSTSWILKVHHAAGDLSNDKTHPECTTMRLRHIWHKIRNDVQVQSMWTERGGHFNMVINPIILSIDFKYTILSNQCKCCWKKRPKVSNSWVRNPGFIIMQHRNFDCWSGCLCDNLWTSIITSEKDKNVEYFCIMKTGPKID